MLFLIGIHFRMLISMTSTKVFRLQATKLGLRTLLTLAQTNLEKSLDTVATHIDYQVSGSMEFFCTKIGKKAQNSGLLGKNVVVYLNLNQWWFNQTLRLNFQITSKQTYTSISRILLNKKIDVNLIHKVIDVFRRNVKVQDH